jgi:hypothetical protein
MADNDKASRPKTQQSADSLRDRLRSTTAVPPKAGRAASNDNIEIEQIDNGNPPWATENEINNPAPPRRMPAPRSGFKPPAPQQRTSSFALAPSPGRGVGIGNEFVGQRVQHDKNTGRFVIKGDDAGPDDELPHDEPFAVWNLRWSWVHFSGGKPDRPALMFDPDHPELFPTRDELEPPPPRDNNEMDSWSFNFYLYIRCLESEYDYTVHGAGGNAHRQIETLRDKTDREQQRGNDPEVLPIIVLGTKQRPTKNGRAAFDFPTFKIIEWVKSDGTRYPA